jgi:hypothetical protein
MTTILKKDYYKLPADCTEAVHIAQALSYNLGTVFTYIWRAGRKPEADALDDLRKAAAHLQFEIERLQAERE